MLIVLVAAARIWTEYLWFQEVSFETVFITRIWAWSLAALAGALLFLAIFLPNLYLARRLSPRIRISSNRADDVVVELVPVGDKTVMRVILGVSLVLALFFALTAGALWPDLLLFLNQASFGFSDPIFDRDASFYVFTLPVMSGVHAFIWTALVLTLAGTIAVYVFDRAILMKEGERGLFLAPHVKAHLSVLAALALVLKAGGYAIDAWKLNFAPGGVVFGAGYADIHARLPVLYILAIVALASAVIFLVNIHYRGWRLPLAAVGLLVIFWIGAGQIYPALVQQYRVSPNEIVTEAPYIEDNITATRFAFGLDRVTSRPFPAEQQLTLADFRANEATVDNIRLWDPGLLLQNYNQLQALRLYYTFVDVDVDRYDIDGDYRQVMLSAREMDQGGLQPQARTWVNQHLTYTHGYGVVVSPVNEATAEGLPPLLVRDIPPRTEADLSITRPEIYFGELGNDYVLVKTEANEFDYPQGDQNVFSTYEGQGGVPVASFLRTAAFSVRFGTLKLLFSDYLTDESRIMYNRTIQERVRKVAPFLSFDGDPYLVIRDDGSLFWIWDAYTTTGNFPYSQPRSTGLNYLRNSVKAVVDAYNGDITLYQVDPDDALANAWNQVYEGLLTPGDEMPEDLRRHVRYPEDLFSIQAEVLLTYHMQDPQVFYNKEDVWEIPRERYSNQEVPVLPYYVIMGLPGEGQEEMVLLQPFTPSQRLNMVGWMGARMDGDSYGELVVFEFPKQSQVFGPSQIESRISNDPRISEQITLWDQAGSNVIRGNLLVIPLEDAVVYVEPLYLQADTSPIPELRRVIASYDNRVTMLPSLGEALEALFQPGSGRSTTVTTQPEAGPTTTDETTGTTEPGATTTTTPPSATTTTTSPAGPGEELPSERAALIALAQQQYLAALEAQRAGDWSEYGRQIEELGRVLRALEAAP
jgi:uncharacterized membrane protein (UPF0182 family)